MEQQSAFCINFEDNVATALVKLEPGEVRILGDTHKESENVTMEIPMGHKLALCDIKKGENIVKYGVVIGRSTADIPEGSWVHLHVMESLYDTRSSHLDEVTGAPKDTKYE
ncbi:MAG: UxaA family hydrolase [Eubacteriales bacterium]|nr:UxaA family hydrolase [Eubacteriales bacterium]